jgi:hypothetical protein
MGNDTKTAESSPIRLDLDWQKERENFLDWGREPRFPTYVDVGVTSFFFVLIWVAATLLSHAEWSVGAAAIASVALFSFRARSFNRAYQAYLRARGRKAPTA